MWERYGDTWVLKELPFITVEPLLMVKGGRAWVACCGGRLVPHISPSTNSADVMRRTEKYYDERIEMTPVKERGLW